ncbi:hypothetical protein QL285_009280 [Trifolium repens]|nr:hypothetical protein QL285_009280 [Trifolium repens]
MQFESSLKNETTKFQALHENFYKEKATYLQDLQGKKKKSMMSEQEKACNDKITQLEGSLKKKKGIGLSSLSRDPNQAI